MLSRLFHVKSVSTGESYICASKQKSIIASLVEFPNKKITLKETSDLKILDNFNVKTRIFDSVV